MPSSFQGTLRMQLQIPQNPEVGFGVEAKRIRCETENKQPPNAYLRTGGLAVSTAAASSDTRHGYAELEGSEKQDLDYKWW